MIKEEDIAKTWYERVVWIQYGHYRAAAYFNRRHWLLGVLTVLFTTGVGTSVFATLANQADLLVLTGALSVLTALSSALQTFLSYGERADKHRQAGARYGVVGRELELMLCKSEFDPSNLIKVKEKLDIFVQECPHIPDIVNKKMERNPNLPKGITFNV